MPIFHQPYNSVGNHTYNVYFYDGIDYQPHFHKNYEVVYVLRGNVFCTVGNRSGTVEEGEFALFLSNEVHSLHSDGTSRVWIGVFSEDFIAEFRNSLNGKTGTDFRFRCTGSRMKYLLDSLIREDLSDHFTTKSCLYALCGEYLKQIPLAEPNARKSELTNRIADYVESNFRKPITLTSLADALGYDYCYLSRSFNRLFSMTFAEYLTVCRFNAACAMLTETDLPITDIAYESGFQSIRSFNNAFRRLAGISPSRFRSGHD